ncbi:MAG: dTDP-4-dehydrorhamnose 3,5-epimerase family protein [Anaerolineae bacterium]
MGTIHDVVVKKLTTHSDDRGYFREILRDDDNILRKFGQTAVTRTYPGVIKAFHWHSDQDDIWYVADGMARVVLYDRRPESPTYKVTQVIYAGEDNPVSILIPTGLAHGYQVLGNKPVLLFYHVTKSYNSADPDEMRIRSMTRRSVLIGQLRSLNKQLLRLYLVDCRLRYGEMSLWRPLTIT